MQEEKEQGLNGNLRCPVYGELSCRGSGCGMYFKETGCCSMVAIAGYMKNISECMTTIRGRYPYDVKVNSGVIHVV